MKRIDTHRSIYVIFVFNQINSEQYALRAKSLLDHKNGIFTSVSRKHVENCGNNPRPVKISSWKKWARRIFQSTRRIARYRCSKVGVIGSLLPDSILYRSIVRWFLTTAKHKWEWEKERSRALKIIYARQNNHISRLRGGGDGARGKLKNELESPG